MSLETEGCHWVGAGNDDGGVYFARHRGRIGGRTAEQQPSTAAPDKAPTNLDTYVKPPECLAPDWPADARSRVGATAVRASQRPPEVIFTD